MRGLGVCVTPKQKQQQKVCLFATGENDLITFSEPPFCAQFLNSLPIFSP